MKKKVCVSCVERKLLKEFGLDRSQKDRHNTYCKECARQKTVDWNRANKEKKHRIYKRNVIKLRTQVLTHYGNGKLMCVRCGENQLPCLTIDHIKGGGNKSRKELGVTGLGFYRWLKQQGFPLGYQTLCANCQLIKREHNEESRSGQ